MNALEKNLKCKTCSIISILTIFISILSINAIAMVQVRGNAEKTSNNSNFPISNSLTCDLKVKYKSNEWQDNSISVKVNDVVEFKGSIQAGENYKEIYVCFLLSESENSIFEYVSASAYPIPSLNEGVFFPTDNAIIWVWFNINQGWQKEMTFKCKAEARGTANVILKVFGVKEGKNYEKCEDIVTIEVTKVKCSRRDISLQNIKTQISKLLVKL